MLVLKSLIRLTISCMYVCMYIHFNSVVHYTSYVNNVRQIKQIQTHPESRPTTESLKDCGWVISNSGWLSCLIICWLLTDNGRPSENFPLLRIY